jgi:hypothetical protein
VKPPKAKPKSPNSKEHATLLLAQNNPSNLTAKILSMIDYYNEKNVGIEKKSRWVRWKARNLNPQTMYGNTST